MPPGPFVTIAKESGRLRNDNSLATIASNHEAIETLHRVKLWKGGKKNDVGMPHSVRAYNNRKGGVDLFDNAMNKYPIHVRGKGGIRH